MREPATAVYLRLCTNELLIVSDRWWQKFLLSQAKALGSRKKELDIKRGEKSTITSVSGTGTENANGDFHQKVERGERRVAV